MAINETNLRAWLRQRPQPHHLRIKDAEGDLKTIELTEASRNRWKAAEQAVLAMGAVTVECLTRDGRILRAKRLGDDDNGEEEPDETPEVREERGVMRHMAAANASTAAMMREQGVAIKEAYTAGAEAANSSQAHLVDLVSVLTNHLSHAITSLHTVSVNFANTMQALANNADPPSQSDQNQAALMHLAAAALTGGGGIPGVTPPGPHPPKPNHKQGG